ncbi:hypothetical protein C8Q79DRAFT_330754 [Trametes meyenii]|nr:hypothetical protein C8Q79DRAFT_330754 [Trametes meyenii]
MMHQRLQWHPGVTCCAEGGRRGDLSPASGPHAGNVLTSLAAHAARASIISRLLNRDVRLAGPSSHSRSTLPHRRWLRRGQFRGFCLCAIYVVNRHFRPSLGRWQRCSARPLRVAPLGRRWGCTRGVPAVPGPLGSDSQPQPIADRALTQLGTRQDRTRREQGSPRGRTSRKGGRNTNACACSCHVPGGRTGAGVRCMPIARLSA